MQTQSPARPDRRHRPLLAGALALVLCGPAAGDCTIDAPVKFGLVNYSGKYKSGFETSLSAWITGAGARRLVLRENFGFAVFSLNNPSQPFQDGFLDIESKPGYGLGGDGFSMTSAVGTAGDGSRLLVGYRGPHGTLLMAPSGSSFTFAGDFSPSEPGDVAVVLSGATARGYALLKDAGLFYANVTSLTSPNPTVPLGLPSSRVLAAPIPTVAGHLRHAGPYLAYATGSSVAVLNTVSGVVGTISRAILGFGASDRVAGVSIGIHPVDGKVYVVAEATGSQNHLLGYGAASSPDGVTFSSLGPRYVPASPFSGAASHGTGVGRMLASSTDLVAFHVALGGTKTRLVTMPLSAWGTDLSTGHLVDPANVPGWGNPADLDGFWSATDSTFRLYLAATYGAFSLRAACGAPAPSLAFGVPKMGVVGTPIPVQNQSTIPIGVTDCNLPATTTPYAYSFCSGAGCSASPSLALTFAGGAVNLPAPSAAGVHQLRVRYTYSTTGAPGCVSPLLADWSPAVSGNPDPKAWPIVVEPVPLATLFHPMAPCRVLDTRLPAGLFGGPALPADGSAPRVFPFFDASSACVIPVTARAVAANVTVTGATAPGAVTLWPANLPNPGTAATAFVPGKTRASLLFLELPSDGSGNVAAVQSSTAAADLIVDVSGWFE